MLGWAAGPAGGQVSAALRGERYGPLPPSGWPDKVPPADLIPCGGNGVGWAVGLLFRLVVEVGVVVEPSADLIPCGGNWALCLLFCCSVLLWGAGWWFFVAFLRLVRN